uniref:AMP-binding domain-containing protein n=1 Tax=Steinernema glaseri TaxID=37863 RepID=A0A1I7YIB3_9BILA
MSISKLQPFFYDAFKADRREDLFSFPGKTYCAHGEHITNRQQTLSDLIYSTTSGTNGERPAMLHSYTLHS